MITLNSKLCAIALVLFCTTANGGYACELAVENPYLQFSFPSAKAAALYMQINNPCESEDKLISVSSNIAAITELHQSIENKQGVVSMKPVENGIEVPAKGILLLEPGGLHVMLMGVELFENHTEIDFKLEFEQSGIINASAPTQLLSH